MRFQCLNYAVSASVVLAASVFVLPQSALAAPSAEARRLIDNVKMLAKKNAWSGVERNYDSLLALNEPIPFDVHMLGAQAASTQGKVFEWYERLERAYVVNPNDEVKQNIDAINATYERVEINGKERYSPILSVKMMPFAPDQRRAVIYAKETLAGKGSFRGMLPRGLYGVGSHEFEIAGAKSEWIELKLKASDLYEHSFDGQPVASSSTEDKGKEISKDKTNSKDKVPHDVQDVDLVIYKGPLFGISGVFSTAGGPKTALAEGLIEPAAMKGPGFGLKAGYEVGFSYVFAVAVEFEYAHSAGRGKDISLFAPSEEYVAAATMNHFTSNLSGVFRPGDGAFRINVGPTLSLIKGSGDGVSVQTNLANYVETKVEDLSFKGRSVAVGGHLGLSYGLLDLEPFLGVVQLGGSIMGDGARTWSYMGISVGILPKVPHYEG